MSNRLVRHRHGAAGQAMVLMVGGMVGVLALLALIIDGGNAWSQQRVVQNGTDAAAEAGAVILAERFAGATPPASGWDAAVQSAIATSAAANGLTVDASYYTDVCGIPLTSTGTAALNADGTYDFAAADQVGSGLPTITNTTPNCPSLTVGPVAGVLVTGHRSVSTYVAGVVGVTSLRIGAQSTAASGFLQESCSAAQGEACAVLPIAVPVNIVTCGGNNQPIFPGGQWVADGKTVYKVPLCSNSPGNIGWLDWTPPGGGTSDIINEIVTPNNPAIPLPSWQYVTSTGNPNTAGLESAIRAYDGQIVLLPQFDLTCNPGPNQSPDNTQISNQTANYGCLNSSTNDLGGNGQNQWYRIPSFAHFQLCIATDPDCAAAGASYGAYINGNNSSICDTGNGATSCLVGKFESIVSSGTVGPGYGGGSGNSKAVGVQLIK